MSEPSSSTEEEDFWIFGYGSLIWKPPPHYALRVPCYIKSYVRRFWQASEDHRGTPTSPGRVVTLIERSHYDRMGEKVPPPQISHTPKSQEINKAKQTSTPPPDVVFGAAYRIPRPHVSEVKEYLDIREINGYSMQYTPFYPLPPPSLASSRTRPPPPSGAISPTTPTAGPALPTHTLPPTLSAKRPNALVYIGLPSNPQFVGLESVDATARVVLGAKGPSGANREYLFELYGALGGLGERDEHVEELVGRVRELVREEGGEGVGIGRNGNRAGVDGGRAVQETEKGV